MAAHHCSTVGRLPKLLYTGTRGKEGYCLRGKEGYRLRGKGGYRLRGKEGYRLRGKEGYRLRGKEDYRLYSCGIVPAYLIHIANG